MTAQTTPRTEPREPCERCGGRGVVVWGAIVNGQPTHSGTCFRCGGKGWQDESDKRRNWGYDNFYLKIGA